eukprot:1155848_1
MLALDASLVDAIQKECEMKPNALMPIHEFSSNIQQKIKEFLSQTGHADESKSNLFLIQVPTESCKGDVLRIYLNCKSIQNEDVKQRLKIHLLQKERDRLIEINKKTNKNLTKKSTND